MNNCLWRYILVLASLVFLEFFLRENQTEHVEYSLVLKEKRKIMQQIVQEQINSEIKNHLKAFKEMQKKSLRLHHAKYTLLAGSLPQNQKLLTVGISSGQHPQGSYLLDTLQSLFQASSVEELDYILVLVFLSHADPEWLTHSVANISSLFAPHIEAKRLLVIHGALGGSPVKSRNHSSSPCEELYSRQKADSALLMNFANNLSDYFLLLEDNVQCAPRFVSVIYWTLLAWKELPWVILEFSSLGVSGKVLRTRDLSRLTSFFLLFLDDIPIHSLLSEFHILLTQDVPIRFSFPLFYHMGSYSELEGTCFPVEKDKVFSDPDNPVATVLTSMLPMMNTRPQYAYILNDEDYFSTYDPLQGNYLLVILDRPQKVIRIAVLTGFAQERSYYLQQGKVLLGYHLLGESYCTYYTLLGPLVTGNLDQRVFYEADSLQKMSCIKLEVSASQQSWLLIRQIRVWVEPEDEES